MDTHIPVSELERHWQDIIRRAEAGEAFILTRNGRPVVRIARDTADLVTPIPPDPAERQRRMAVMRDVAETASAKAIPGPSTVRSQDFLYDAEGLPV